MTTTPNTPAGGAVAWSYEHNFGDDKWETRLTFSQPVESAWNRNIRPLAYTDATVPLDAVRGLIAKWRAEASGTAGMRQEHDADSAYDSGLDACADELEALTRGEGNG